MALMFRGTRRELQRDHTCLPSALYSFWDGYSDQIRPGLTGVHLSLLPMSPHSIDVSPGNIFTDKPTVSQDFRAPLDPVKQNHKTNNHTDHLKGLTMSTRSPLPQILVTETGTCLGEGPVNLTASGALLKGICPCTGKARLG